MKQKVKSVINRIFYRLFGHTPFPQSRGTLQFNRINVPERNVSCREFNAIAINIYKLSNNL